MTVTVYGKPNCQACVATTRMMDRLGIEYESVDMSRDAQALEMVLAEGHTQAPVVKAGGDTWTGYNREKIREIAGLLTGQALPAAA